MFAANNTATILDQLYAEDVFSTYLYTGNGSSQSITNGIDLSGKGGMVWIKRRDSTENHFLFDTARGANNEINSNTTDISTTLASSLTAFNSDGFSLGSATGVNTNTGIYTSWSFGRGSKFFDVVQYTGNGQVTQQSIPHSLGVAPGLILIKRTSGASSNWFVYHTSRGANSYLTLNSTAAASSITFTSWNATSTVFGPPSISGSPDANVNGATYIAYLFAHNAASDGLIRCGEYTGNGSATGPTVTLGWEPQFVLIKRALGGVADWLLLDETRGMAAGGNDAFLYASVTNTETNAGDRISPTASGFQVTSSQPDVNSSGSTYVYVAIRRPNKPPTVGTQVFMPTAYTGTNTDNRLVNTTIAPDLVLVRQRDDSTLTGMVVADRLRGQPYVLTGSTAAEVTSATALDMQIVSTVEYGNAFSSMNGFYAGTDATAKLNVNTTANNHIANAFVRAYGTMDQICYAGTGANKNESHNLGVAPELWLVKSRSGTNQWVFGSSLLNNTEKIVMPTVNGRATDTTVWNSTYPTATTIRLGTSTDVNGSGLTYTCWMWATRTGVSKVGTYTGNGSSQTIDMGFTTGARFLMVIRATAATAQDIYVWDSARGIVAGNDPRLSLNTAAAEVSSDDSVDPDNSGIVVNQVAATNINVNGAVYLYLAYS